MKDRPELQLVGHDGNIYAIMGSAAKLLRRAGMREEADEMFKRVTSSGSYEQALGIVSEYVQTELSKPDMGILEEDDIGIDTEFTYGDDGITAYVETWFDVKEKFPISLDDTDYIDLYATYNPETEKFTATAVTVYPDGGHEYNEVHLLPCERKIILSQMEQVSQEQSHQSLKEQFADWKAEYGDKQKNTPAKENRNNKHER